MTCWSVDFSFPLEGSIRPPGSKSQTLRAILFASLSQEGGIIRCPLESQDSIAMTLACESLGVVFEKKTDVWQVKPASQPISSSKTLCFDAMNSGIVWRFLAGVLSTRENLSLIWGDHSILNRRPIQPLVRALSQTGVDIWQTQSSRGPCLVKGPWKRVPKVIEMDGLDSQPVSAMLIASALQESVTPIAIQVRNPKEVQWAYLTVHWLRSLGVKVEADPLGEKYLVYPSKWKSIDYTVPVDYSSAAFMIAAALVSKGQVTIQGLVDDPQPDQALLGFLKEAGADINLKHDELHVNGQVPFNGFEADLSGPIDLLPILMTLACYAQSPSCFYSIGGARLKESDRVSCMANELSKMGARIEVFEDKVKVWPSSLTSCLDLQSHDDHRLAMALAVAALGAKGTSKIHQVQCSNKTYPNFVQDLKHLGAKIAASEN